MADAVHDLVGEIHQWFAREEHGDCGDDPGRCDRPCANGIDCVLGEIRTLVLRAFPGTASKCLRTEPILEPLRCRHEPRAPALDLVTRGGDFRRLAHKSRLRRSAPHQPSPPAIAAKISRPTTPARRGPMNLARAMTTPTASAVTAARARTNAVANSATGARRASALLLGLLR